MKTHKLPPNFDLMVVTAEYDLPSGAPAAAEHAVFTVPDLSLLAAFSATRERGAIGQNSLKLREAYIVAEATFTGVITNNGTLKINQWRGGANVATLVSVTVDNTVTLTKFVQKLLDASKNLVALQAGDVITLQIVVNGTGGAALPAMRLVLDFDAYVNRQ